jgi:hypothetical protein
MKNLKKQLTQADSVRPSAAEYHVKKIFTEQELCENSVIRNCRKSESDSKRYNPTFCALHPIISVGFKIHNEIERSTV